MVSILFFYIEQTLIIKAKSFTFNDNQLDAFMKNERVRSDVYCLVVYNTCDEESILQNVPIDLMMR